MGVEGIKVINQDGPTDCHALPRCTIDALWEALVVSMGVCNKSNEGGFVSSEGLASRIYQRDAGR